MFLALCAKPSLAHHLITTPLHHEYKVQCALTLGNYSIPAEHPLGEE